MFMMTDTHKAFTRAALQVLMHDQGLDVDVMYRAEHTLIVAYNEDQVILCEFKLSDDEMSMTGDCAAGSLSLIMHEMFKRR